VKSVFVTGSTGTIGSALVPRLLNEESASLTLLMRARDDAELRSRLADMLAYWGMQSGDGRTARIRPLRGDITLPNFGLGEAGFAELAAHTTHVIHCAASVKLNMPMEQARATAVAPTRTLLDLGRRCAAAGMLRKMDLVSTVGVWGRTPGHMPERPLPDVKEFHNTYEAAKSEAERVVWSDGRGLPITVHRPSMVVGETHSGRVIHFQVFYHLCEFLSGVRTFGIMPDLDDTALDIVSVDWVADAICWSSRHEQTAGKILHLCSGPEEAIRLPQLQVQVRRAWQAAGRRVPPLRRVNRKLLERLIPAVGLLVGAKTRRALRGLPPVLAYLVESQGFSNTKTAALLHAAGLPVPPVQSYLGPVLDYYLAKRGGRPTT
jgi:thioester reductase-like protein